MYKLLILIGIGFGLLLFRFSSILAHQPVYADKQEISFVATLVDVPKLREDRQVLKVQTPDKLNVQVHISAFPQFHAGDRLRISGKLSKRIYEDYTFWAMYYPQIIALPREETIISSVALSLKERAIELFVSTLPPISSALLMGILFGGDHGMPEDFIAALQTTGVMHIVAASGMNVAFVAGALLAVLGSFMPRQAALLLGLAGIAFYALLAGFEPPIVRAALMAGFAFSASLLGRPHLALLSLVLTAYLMLLFDPLLLWDVGFQLSFAATLGILLIKPLFGSGGKCASLREDIMTTTAAQIATLPIMLVAFKQYGVLSIFVNALVLWMIPILMFFGSIGLMIGLIIPPIGKGIILLCLPFLALFEGVIWHFGSSGLLLSVEHFSVGLAALYYFFLGIILFRLHRQRETDEQEKSLVEEIGI